MDLQIGKVGREAFTLPLGIVSDAAAVMGVRGKGKTSTVVVIVEEALDNGVQPIIIDPTDVWWGLKSSKSGKSAGYPVVILGGPHGDLPLAAEGGAALADFAVENRVPMILSLRHLRKGAAQRFVAEFLEQLYHRKGEPEHRRPLLVVMDEASRYVPQKVMNEKGSYLTRSVGAVEDIVRQGRASGFGIIMLDQRPASVNKDVLTQIELLVAHAVTSPQDRAALDEWVKGKDTRGHREEFLRDLASLEKGEAWFWRPSSDLFARVRVRDRRTFDSSKTPEIGEEAATPEKFAKVDLGVLQAQLEAAVAEAIENDPKRLRKEIAELKRQVAEGAGSGGPSEDEIEARVEAALAEQRADMERLVRTAVEALALDLRDPLEQMVAIIGTHAKLSEQVLPPVRSYASRPAANVPDMPARRLPPARAPRKVAAPSGDGTLSGPQQRVLDAIVWYAALGVKQPGKTEVGFIAGYRVGKKVGGTYGNILGQLHSAGLISYPTPGAVQLTPSGDAVANDPGIPSTNKGLQDAVYERLDGPERRVLSVLVDAYPAAVGKADVGEAANYQVSGKVGGTFGNILGRLRSLGLIDYPQPGYAVAADLLFPRGKRG